jgi:hypothetical protein
MRERWVVFVCVIHPTDSRATTLVLFLENALG